jgi:general secretion pathway protein K
MKATVASSHRDGTSKARLAPRATSHDPLLPSLNTGNPCSPFSHSERGIALVIVMISILVLTILAAGFAYAMKVETKLARNANSEAELEWLGRSGVEYARWVLGNSLLNPMQPYDSLDQPWATGSGLLGPTNNPIAEVQNTFTLGHGTVSWKITDLESKFNINAPEAVLQQVLPQALTLIGVSPGEATPVVNSILDWIDTDDHTHPEGAETRYYEGLIPPYAAKNGPIDDISELLLIKDVTPEIYYGGVLTNYQPNYVSRQRNPYGQSANTAPTVVVGLTNLFTPLSDGKVNINTASAEVLQVLPGIDAMIAEAIVGGRAGEDDGSGLMGPYRAVNQVSRLPNLPLPLVGQLGQYCDVRSKTFKVDVTATMNGYTRNFTAILGRNNQRDVQILSFYWSDPAEPRH